MGTGELPAGRPTPGTLGRGRRVSPTLIGRDPLLALAARRSAAARAGSGELLLLAGEAGIGKTRLLSEIVRRAEDEGFTVGRAAAFASDVEAAGGVLADLAADLRRLEATADLAARIERRLRDGGEGGDPHRQRRLLVTDLAAAILSLGSGTGPVLLACEDLHWADDLTLEVLGRVAHRLAGLPMLVVGTYRSDELYPRVPMRAWRTRLLHQRLAEEARLDRLSRADTSAMAVAIAQAVLPNTVTGTVFELSDGIPLHVEEFLAAMSGTRGRAEVPETLADAVRARAGELTARTRALASAASVIGRSFDLDLLTAITGERPERVDEGLRELAERFFVVPHGDRSTHDFRHALIRDALYADLTPHRRRELHRRAADAAAAAGFRDAFVSDQYERARQPALAYRHALAGAAQAVGMSAHREAVELYRRAQRTMPTVESDAARARLLAALAGELAAIDDNIPAEAAYAEAYAIRRRLGDDRGAASLVPDLVAVRHLLGAGLDQRSVPLREALTLLGDGSAPSTQDSQDARDAGVRIHAALSAAYMLDRRLDEATEHGERARSLAVGLGDHPIRHNIDATLGSVLVFAGRTDEGWRLLEGAIAGAIASGAEAEAARGYRMIGSTASVLVEYERGLPWLREGIEYAERTERFNDRHYMAAHLAHVLWATGDWPAADREARLALADGGGGITTRITALHVLGYLAVGRGDWSVAEQHLTEAAVLGEGMRELQRVSPAWWGLAETALGRGRPDEAIDWCARGYEASSAVRDAAYLYPYLVTGTRAYLARDDGTGAGDWVDRVAQLLLLRRIPGTLGAIDHANGLLLLHQGQTGKARYLLDEAATFWARRQRFWEGTRALIDQARCAARSRRPGEAAARAAQARELAAAAGATTLLEAAERVSTPVAEPDTRLLSARESEVARLVATGATNREIAEALSIAPKTVAAHVEHILAKLGASRRAQIATWVTTQHPAAPD
jgi:DNA-binding CsgD family transcriptional regulator